MAEHAQDKHAAVKAGTAPEPEDPRKPEGPSHLTRRAWLLTFRRAVHEFVRDQGTDLAAALTYYAVLSVFPALLALVSLLGVFGQGERSVDTIMELGSDVAPTEILEQVRPVVDQMINAQAAGFALVAGLLVALWTASNYINAFSRAMNRVYEITEGRPIWKLRPLFLLLTLVLVALVALVLVGLVVSGPVARWVGDLVGLGSTAVTLWNVAKWPVILLIVAAIVALLYYVTPNVRQPKFRWLSVGAFIAILVWVLASIGFGFYVTNFGNYNRTYGALAGVIIALLWLWITNLALIFGAEVDAELERSRELQGGIKAEEAIQLPPRGTAASEKAAARRADLVQTGREIRLAHTEPDADVADSQDARAHARD